MTSGAGFLDAERVGTYRRRMSDKPNLAQQWSRWTFDREYRALLFVFPAVPAASWLMATAYQGSADMFDGGGWLFGACVVALLAGLLALRGSQLDETVPRPEHEDVLERLEAAQGPSKKGRQHAG